LGKWEGRLAKRVGIGEMEIGADVKGRSLVHSEF
jgi:hypothetical protein